MKLLINPVSLFLSLTIVLFGSILFVNAQENAPQEEEPTQEVEVLTGTQYLSGDWVEVTKQIKGDVFLTSNDATVKSRIDEKLFYIGNSLRTEERIKDSVFAIGNLLRINGDVHNSVFAIGSKIQIKGDVLEDVFIIGDQVILSSNIGDDVYISAKTVYLDESLFNGEVNINAENFYISPKVKKAKDSSFKLNGEVVTDFNQYATLDIPLGVELLNDTNSMPNPTESLIMIPAVLFGSTLATWLLVKFFRKKADKVLANMKLDLKQIFKNLISGFIYQVVLLVLFVGYMLMLLSGISVLQYVSLILMPLLIIYFLTSLLLISASKLYLPYFIGESILNKFKFRFSNIFTYSLVGNFVLLVSILILSFIPYVGVFLTIVSAVLLQTWSLGSVLGAIKMDYHKKA